MTMAPSDREALDDLFEKVPILGTLENKLDALTRQVEDHDRKINRIYEDIEALHRMIVYMLEPQQHKPGSMKG